MRIPQVLYGTDKKVRPAVKRLMRKVLDGKVSFLETMGETVDTTTVSEEPRPGVAAPVPPHLLSELYGTTKPTREMVEAELEILDDLERGECVYLVLYDGAAPAEICFAGYSFD